MRAIAIFAGITLGVLTLHYSHAGIESIGPSGIDAAGLGLTGFQVAIGQVEIGRPSKLLFDSLGINVHVNPREVFYRDDPAIANQHLQGDGIYHALQVAGIMISDGGPAPGVAKDADLYAAAFVGILDPPTTIYPIQESLNGINSQNGRDVRAINLSFGTSTLSITEKDGRHPVTLYVDWSSRIDNVLYVTAFPNKGQFGSSHPADDFNGITVVQSRKVSGVYSQVDPVSAGDFSILDADGIRTSIDIMAPGVEVETTDFANTISSVTGSSFATPHVTGTVALLQELADRRIGVVDPVAWNVHAARHEVMKAVLLNSADKIQDTSGTSTLLDMTRTVTDTNGNGWVASEAYSDQEIPLDDQMGAGHLNARRALRQFGVGESAELVNNEVTVGAIGWDLALSPGPDIFTYEPSIVKYKLADPLDAGDYVSATLVWDRQIRFDDDRNGNGRFDVDANGVDADTFIVPTDPRDTFNDLNPFSYAVRSNRHHPGSLGIYKL
jgi:hypothetical protein